MNKYKPSNNELNNLIDIKVSNMTSNSNNPIANQFIIVGYDKLNGNRIRIFQSYDSIIVKIVNGQTFISKNTYDYSVTTGKYRNIFLGESLQETRAKIKSGEYKLVHLNQSN